MDYFGAISYSLAAMAFPAFVAVIIARLRQNFLVVGLSVASLLSACWAIVAAYLTNDVFSESLMLELFETLRKASWLLFLYFLIFKGGKNTKARSLIRKLSIVVVALIVGNIILFAYFVYDPILFISSQGLQYRFIGQLLMAALGLFLVEQLIRHVDPDQRWSIKYLCFGLGGLFT